MRLSPVTSCGGRGTEAAASELSAIRDRADAAPAPLSSPLKTSPGRQEEEDNDDEEGERELCPASGALFTPLSAAFLFGHQLKSRLNVIYSQTPGGGELKHHLNTI